MEAYHRVLACVYGSLLLYHQLLYVEYYLYALPASIKINQHIFGRCLWHLTILSLTCIYEALIFYPRHVTIEPPSPLPLACIHGPSLS